MPRGSLPYLADLGVSHVYLSPCLQAAPGSLHGYDVTDPDPHQRGSRRRGGLDGFRRRSAARSGLEILLDIVPNHMSASEHNPWWDDVLAHGPFSEFAEYLRHPTAAGSAVPRAHLHAGARLRRGARRRGARDRPRGRAGRGSSTSTTAGRWVRPPGARCSAPRTYASASTSSSGCAAHGKPGDAERARLSARGRGARSRCSMTRIATGGCEPRSSASAAIRTPLRCRHRSGSSTRCTAGSSRANWPITGASSMSAALVGIRTERPRGVRGDARAHRGDDRAAARSTDCASIIRTACAIRAATSSGCASCCRQGASTSRRSWRTTSGSRRTGRSTAPWATTSSPR